MDFDSMSELEQIVSDVTMSCCALNILWTEKKEPRFMGFGSNQIDELIWLHLSLLEQYVSDLNVLFMALSNNLGFNLEVDSDVE